MATPDFCYWDHLPDLEDVKQYDAFSVYRDLGLGRTLVDVARLTRNSYGTICKWSNLFAWRERADEFDRHHLAERTAALEAKRAVLQASWVERRAVILEQLESIVMLGEEQLLHDLRSRDTRLRPNELRLLAETLTKWQNLANGDVTERLDLGIDLSNLTTEELETYLALQEKTQTAPEAQTD